MTNTMYQDLDVKGLINALKGSPEFVAALRQDAIPVGASMYCVESPAAYYGGTWEEQDKDKFPLAAGDIYPAGSMGGEATHTMTLDELVSHGHRVNMYAPSSGTTTGLQVTTTGALYATEITTGSGGGQPFNILPPYTAKKFWTKIA